jgi:hypothetical protein
MRERAGVPITACMRRVDWEELSLAGISEQIRRSTPGPDAEKAVWALERVLEMARIDEELLGYVLAAAACYLAHLGDCSPRDVLETFFRRSVSDDEWRERYLPLL